MPPLLHSGVARPPAVAPTRGGQFQAGAGRTPARAVPPGGEHRAGGPSADERTSSIGPDKIWAGLGHRLRVTRPRLQGRGTIFGKRRDWRRSCRRGRGYLGGVGGGGAPRQGRGGLTPCTLPFFVT